MLTNKNRVWRLIFVLNVALMMMPKIVSATEISNAETVIQYVDSSMITLKVKAVLLGTPGLQSSRIKVKTYQHRVDLYGSVDSAHQSELAELVVKEVIGVKSVNNALSVRLP